MKASRLIDADQAEENLHLHVSVPVSHTVAGSDLMSTCPSKSYGKR